MDDEERRFTLATCRLVAGALCVMVATFAGCTVYVDHYISEDIQHGAAPLEAWCAHSANPNYVLCASVARPRS